jgi:hypothetical protein
LLVEWLTGAVFFKLSKLQTSLLQAVEATDEQLSFDSLKKARHSTARAGTGEPLHQLGRVPYACVFKCPQ